MRARSPQDIENLIADGRRLAAQAKVAMAAADRFLAEHGLDPAGCMEVVRRRGGEAAVQAVEAQVQQEIQRIEEEVQRRRMHDAKPVAGARLVRMRANLA